jgi:hypothetical protein
VKGLLIAGLAALWAILLGMIKADLEDQDVCRWLARKLMYRATQSLPVDERDRWREELIRDLLDLKGRIAPLLWALSVYVQAGRWGRERGVPSRRDLLAMRVRLTWERLRSLTAKLARARSKQRHPSQNPTTAQQIVVTGIETKEAFGTATLEARLTGSAVGVASAASYGPPTVWVDQDDGPTGQPHLTYPAFLAWLRQERTNFEADIDRKVQAWRAEAWQEVEVVRQPRA